MIKKNIRIPKIKFKIPEFQIFSYSSFSVKKQQFFAKRLSFLIKAGVPILESIHLIKEQTSSKSDIKVFSRVITDVSNGQTLASSLARFKGVFGNFAINIIRAGESSGTLTDNLHYLAEELKKKEILKKKIMSSLLYPLIITFATFGITGLLIVYIFPKILPIFESLNAELPITTKIIIFLSNAIRHYGLYIFLVLIALIIAFFVTKKRSPAFKFFVDGMILKVPLFGIIAKNYNLTNVCRTLGLLLKSGVTLSDALLITSDTTENTQYRKAFSDLSRSVMEGKGMSVLIQQYPKLFPDMLSHMIAIGERSGNLSNTLIYLSEYYENEFDELNKNLSSSIEPVLMIVMGLLVGFVAISVITPIYAITNSIKR